MTETPLPIGKDFPTGSLTVHVIYEADTERFRLRCRFVNFVGGRSWFTTTHVKRNGHTGTDLTNALINAIEEFEEFASVPM